MIWKRFKFEDMDVFARPWRELEARMAMPNPFLTREWLKPLDNGELRFLTCLSDDGKTMKALLPLRMIKPRIWGAGGYVFSECFTSSMIDHDVDETEFQSQAREMLDSLNAGLLRFSAVPEMDPAGFNLTSGLAANGWASETRDGKESPITEYTGSYDDFWMNHFSRHKRRHMKKALKTLNAAGEAKFVVLTGKDDWMEAIPTMQAVESKSWKSETGLFSPGKIDATMGQLKNMAHCGSLLIFLLYVNDKMAGWLIDILWRDRLFAHNICYDPGFANGAPGNLLWADSVRYCLENGHQGIEWLGGRSRGKDSMATGYRQRRDIDLFKKSISGKLIKMAVEARKKVKVLREKEEAEPDKAIAAKTGNRSKNKAVASIIAALLIPLLALTAPAPAKAAMLDRLRQGRVYIKAASGDEQVQIRYYPAYGWDEPLQIYGPDGRLVLRKFLGHNQIGDIDLKLNRGPGRYTIILKPSYIWRIKTSASKMVWQPPQYQTGLAAKWGQVERFYFHSPINNPQFDLNWINYRGFQGKSARLRLFSPDGKPVADRIQKRVVKKDLIKKMMGMEAKKMIANSMGTDLIVFQHPLPPDRIRMAKPDPGFWSIQLGTTEGFKADDTGLWLEGAPSYFASSPDEWWLPAAAERPVKAKVQITSRKLSRPFLGIVGGRGNVGSLEDKLLAGFGMEGQKIFLRQSRQEPVNDNDDPNTLNRAAMDFKGYKKLARRDGLFSLVVLRWWAKWMEGLPVERQAAEWGEWAQAAADDILNIRKIPPKSFVLQPFNEANLEVSVPWPHYLRLLKAAGSRIKSDPATRDCRIAAPGLGSGEEPGVIDFEWLKNVLLEADQYVDVVTFNLYRVRELEDTFLYVRALKETARIIREHNPDGVIEDIIIGATNRKGGFAPDNLFNTWSASLWWASVLCQVVDTGLVDGIYYYNIIDKGIRRKGMFTTDMTPKSQIYVHRLFAETTRKGTILKTTTDHDALEGLCVMDNKASSDLILVNKGEIDIEAELHAAGAEVEIERLEKIDQHGKLAKTLSGSAANRALIPAGSIVRLHLKPIPNWTLGVKTEKAINRAG